MCSYSAVDRHQQMQGALLTNFSQNFTTDNDMSALRHGDTLQLLPNADGTKLLPPGKVAGRIMHAGPFMWCIEQPRSWRTTPVHKV